MTWEEIDKMKDFIYQDGTSEFDKFMEKLTMTLYWDDCFGAGIEGIIFQLDMLKLDMQTRERLKDEIIIYIQNNLFVDNETIEKIRAI